MKVDGQLLRAQLECRSSDLANTITGAIWFRTDSGAVKLATGSGYITLTSGAPDGSSLQNVADVWSVKALGVTNAMLAGSVAYSKLILTNSIVADDITALAITTAKINTAAVTKIKLAALVTQTGNPINVGPLTATGLNDVSGGDTGGTLTTIGRQVFVGIQPQRAATSPGSIVVTGAGYVVLSLQVSVNGGGYNEMMEWKLPAGTYPSLFFTDLNGGSTSVQYKLQYGSSDGVTSLTIANMNVFCFEL